jgi:hypothetical protein
MYHRLVASNGITFTPSFIIVGELVQNLKWANKENMRNKDYLITKNIIFQANHMAPENIARQAMYLYRYIQAPLCNVLIPLHSGTFVQCFLQWKSNKHYIYRMCVCNVWYQACNARHSVTCGLSGSTVFFRIT